MTDKQPTALRLADQLYSRAKNEASRRNSAYDVFGMDNTPENTHPLETAAAAELRRLYAQAAQDEALLRRALEALIWTTGSEDFGEGGLAREGALKLLFPTIAILRERLGAKENSND